MVMRSATILVVLLTAFPGSARAGANEGACVMASCGSVTKTTPTSCSALGGRGFYDLTPNANTQLAPLQSWVAVYVGRFYPPSLSLMGVDFGISYDPNALRGPVWTHCGAFEVQQTGWPAPNTGTSVVWTAPQSGETALVGYFTLRKYAGYALRAYDFVLGAHPLYGVARAVDNAANFDDLWIPGIANLAGSGGYNCWLIIPIEPATWGRIKAQYGS